MSYINTQVSVQSIDSDEDLCANDQPAQIVQSYDFLCHICVSTICFWHLYWKISAVGRFFLAFLITLFENKYGIKLITLISMYHLNLL